MLLDTCLPSSITDSITIRARTRKDLPAVVQLAKRVYAPPHPPEAIWQEETLLSHLSAFPEGQLVVENSEGRIIADSSALRVSTREAFAGHTWHGITGCGALNTHQPQGEVFYGVDIMVDPQVQGRGIGQQLYHARKRLARELGCRFFIAGARIPGFNLTANGLSVEAYVRDVISMRRFDPTLSRQLKAGFTVMGILPNYFRDFESRDFAVLICLPII